MKRFFLVIIVTLFGCGITNAGLSDSFFCRIEPDQVIISLNKTEGFYRCKDMIISLESLIVQATKDLVVIETYIDRKRDLGYRLTIRKEKLLSLERMQSTRKNIIENIKTFENNLIVKTVYYFILSITPYRVNIQSSLVNIDSMTGELSNAIVSYSVLLREQIITIGSLSKVQTVEELVPLLNKYIYLKNEILGKYE